MRTECGAREDEGAHLVDREILQFVGPAPYLDGRVEAALEKDEIGVRWERLAREHRHARTGRAHPAGVAAPLFSPLAEKRLRESESRALLPHAIGAVEEIRVVHASAAESAAKSLDRGRLSTDGGEERRRHQGTHARTGPKLTERFNLPLLLPASRAPRRRRRRFLRPQRPARERTSGSECGDRCRASLRRVFCCPPYATGLGRYSDARAPRASANRRQGYRPYGSKSSCPATRASPRLEGLPR